MNFNFNLAVVLRFLYSPIATFTFKTTQKPPKTTINSPSSTLMSPNTNFTTLSPYLRRVCMLKLAK